MEFISGKLPLFGPKFTREWVTEKFEKKISFTQFLRFKFWKFSSKTSNFADKLTLKFS